jgi:hypothetical protein
MSPTGICSALLVTAATVLSLGCCCPGRFAPIMVRPPPVIVAQPPILVQPPQEDPAALAHKKAADELPQLIAKNLGPNNWAGGLAANGQVWAKIRLATTRRSFKTNASIGGAFANVAFSETHADGGALIGFFAGEDDGGHVGFLQPIYLTAQGEKVGKAYGAVRRPVQCLKAKAGYALGGVDLRAGGVIDAMTLVYMKVNGERLNPADRYTSATLGGPGGNPASFASNGELLIGIHGKMTDNEGFVPAGAIASLGFLSGP